MADAELNDQAEKTMSKKFEILPALHSVAEMHLTYKVKVPKDQWPRIISSTDAFKLLLPHYDDQLDTRELFLILALNRSNRVIGVYHVSSGGISGTVVDIKIIFATLLLAGASGVILSHNHPSGNTQPSNEDLTITGQIEKAAKILGITLYDHVIISSDKHFFSFADEGYIGR